MQDSEVVGGIVAIRMRPVDRQLDGGAVVLPAVQRDLFNSEPAAQPILRGLRDQAGVGQLGHAGGGHRGEFVAVVPGSEDRWFPK